jgi:predicted ATPase/DNA-binding SARP family transcriptional activator
VEFRVLGPLEVVTRDGQRIEVGGAKSRLVLVLLLLRPGGVVPTDVLIDALWGDDAPRTAANALQGLVSKLRRALGSAVDGPRIVTHPNGYSLEVEPTDVDAHRFLQQVASGRARLLAGDAAGASEELREALRSWRGRPEIGFDGQRFGEAEVVDLEQTRLDAVEDRVAADLALGRHAGLVAELEPLTAAFPFRERLWGQLMTALYRCGRQAEALRAFRSARTMLAEELGIEPGPELRQLEIDILNHEPALDAPPSTGAVPPPPPVASRTNLRTPLTACVGRDPDVAAVLELFEHQRLVTLVGPGGVGKTRLGIEVGLAALGPVAPTVLMVELAAVTAGGVTSAVAEAFGDPSSRSHDALIAGLGDSCLLLVLDNCEHVVDDAAALVDVLLRACPALRVLATSREVLGVPGETVWPVAPLALSDAVDLFTARATAAAPRAGIELDDPAVAEICLRLDGLPLALELAAARLRVFPLQQLLDRLGDRFSVLTGGSRTSQARQQTLLALVEWSYDLLFETERRVFERLSVFPDGATLDAAEAVCAGEGVDREHVADVLARLVDKSFVTVDAGPVPARYRMLQTLSAFGLARLAERGELAATRDRHLEWVADFAAEVEPQLLGAGQVAALARLQEEAASVRDAVSWALEASHIVAGMRVAVHLAWHCFIIGDLQRGHQWLRPLLAGADRVRAGIPDDLLIRAKACCGMLGLSEGEEAGQGRDAVDLARAGSHPDVRGEALLCHAFPLSAAAARLDWCRELAAEARQCYQETGNRWGLAHTTALDACILLAAGDLGEAAQAFEDAVQQFRDVGDEYTAGFAEFRLSEVLERRGDLSAAVAVLDRGISFATQTAINANRARYLSQLAWLRAAQDDPSASVVALDAMRMSTEPCNPAVRAHALRAHGAAARRAGDHDTAASGLLAAEQLYRQLGMHQWAALCLTERSRLHDERGEAVIGRQLAIAAVEAARSSADPWTLAIALQRLAAADAAMGSTSRARALLDTSTALRARHGLGHSPAGRREEEQLRRRLDDPFVDPHPEADRPTGDADGVVDRLLDELLATG